MSQSDTLELQEIPNYLQDCLLHQKESDEGTYKSVSLYATTWYWMDGLQQQCQESDSNQHPKTVADKIPAKSIPKLRIVKGLLDSKWLPLSAHCF